MARQEMYKIFTILALQIALTFGKRILTSSAQTDSGSLKKFHHCPNSTYVRGMRLKTEPVQGSLWGDTVLNGVKFYCSDFESESEDNVTSYTIGDGCDYGDWGALTLCNGVATGFQLRSESHQGKFFDVTTANNLRLFCDGHSEEYIQGKGLELGNWTSPQYCSSKEALCGVRIHYYAGKGYGKTIVGIEMDCCDIPEPAQLCEPRDEWKLVVECDNREAMSPMTCNYQNRVGTINSTVSADFSRTNIQDLERYTKIGFTVGGSAPYLKLNFDFNIGESTRTGYNWSSAEREVWNEPFATPAVFQVPPMVRSQVFQVYGTCGFYGILTSKFKKIDFEDFPEY